MKNDEKKGKKRSFNMESADDGLPEGLGTVSASEATGMMYCPPRSEDELRSREQLFSLQTDMPPEGYVGSEREWRSDIERFLEDEAKTPLKDAPINYMARQDVLDPANTFAPIDKP
ncbi:MAG: hypothetical protein IKI64_07475 [Clostridia bacterium]|nr:hypothetical protein [Clostridia bacterium]